MDTNQTPRRIRLDLNLPSEIAIYKAMLAIEEMPGDVRLTNAGIKLQEAKNLVADFIDERMQFCFDPSKRDWPEDFIYENGTYTCKCVSCGLQFNGYKRRVQCKVCATPNWRELAKKKAPEDTKDNKAWAGAWLDGEMTGYARCMVERVLLKSDGGN